MTQSMKAASISIQQALELLDTDFAELAEGVANGQYASWLGQEYRETVSTI